MKNSISILFLAIFLSGTLSAQKIDYYNKSWKDIQAMAKAENRYILIDAYTDWCGWCKVMDKETMTDPKVVEFINKNFVPVKMEMEHGEGTMMAMKYHVSAFPTFMVFSLAGQYVYTITGYQKTEAFMKELNNALDLTQQFSAPGYVANV